MILCFGTTPAISRTMRFASLQLGDVNRATDVYTYAGGKAVNTARAVCNLRETASCVGVQGGLLGSMLLTLLQRDEFPHRFLKTVAATGFVITVVDDARTTATELIEDAPPMTDAIENVQRITVQFDTDGSESVLELTDEKNTLFSLRFESKVDGAS